MEEAFAKSINSNPDPAIVFLPQVAMQFIKFDDLGSVSLVITDFLPQSFYLLIDGHMTKPQDSTNETKSQAF